MIANVDWRTLPAMAGNQLYLDYVSGAGTAADFFTHAPLAFGAALDARKEHLYPRGEVAAALSAYNARIGAHQKAMSNIQALRSSSTFCVIAGQQVGFLGGPMYTAYKIITTIRLAERLSKALHIDIVPLFWLATEDHDFEEINHIYYSQVDGEVGRIKFGWEQKGRPVIDLPISRHVRTAFDNYVAKLAPGSQLSAVQEYFSPSGGDDYCTWHAHIWSQLFSERGLVIAEPTILRPIASGFFESCLRKAEHIRTLLGNVAGKLSSAGYAPALTSPTAGGLYTFDQKGYRIRVADPAAHIAGASENPKSYSTDAALRPLFADTMLPVVASVLGPGEIAYQAMLKPLYELFHTPQPLLFPRKSYTIVAQSERERIERYRLGPVDVLGKELNFDAVVRNLVSPSLLELFASSRGNIEEAFSPLYPYLLDIDPNLDKTWRQALINATRSLDKLEARAIKGTLGKSGLAKRELRALQSALLPRGRLQERVFPLTHFLARYGLGLIEELFAVGDLEDFSHNIYTVGADHV